MNCKTAYANIAMGHEYKFKAFEILFDEHIKTSGQRIDYNKELLLKKVQEHFESQTQFKSDIKRELELIAFHFEDMLSDLQLYNLIKKYDDRIFLAFNGSAIYQKFRVGYEYTDDRMLASDFLIHAANLN